MRISVVIPAYNAASFIAETIESARAQTLQPLEIVVIDDGSADDTSAVASALGCRVIRQANGGVCAARNAGILAAQGDWIALLDHDDIWEPRKLERQAAAVALRPEVACVATDFVRQRSDAVDQVSCLEEPEYALHRMSIEPVAGTIVLCPLAGTEILEPGWFLFPSSVLVRRDTIVEAGLFRPEQRLCEDVDCFLRVLRRTPLLIVREALWRWREHASNASRNTAGIAEGWLKLGAYVRAQPDAYPDGTLARLEPRLRTMRRELVAEYTANGDFRSARRVSRMVLGGRLTPTDAALAVVVEFPPSLWAMLRRARGVFRSLSMLS